MLQGKNNPNPFCALGMNKDKNDTYLIAWLKSDFLLLLNNGQEIDETLVNRMMSVLTSGKCTNHSLCYRPFEKYESFVNDTNLVFGVTKSYEKFDFWNLNMLLLKNNWHFIIGLKYNAKGFSSDIENLLGIYGIKRNAEPLMKYNFGEENLCRDI